MLTLIDGGLTWLDTLSTRASPEHHTRIRSVFEKAHQLLAQRISRQTLI